MLRLRRKLLRLNDLIVVVKVACVRMRARIGQSLVASFVIAGAIAALVVMVAIPKVGEELVLRHTIERLPARDRAVTVVVAPDHLLGANEIQAIDTRLRKRFANLPLGPLRSLVEFRSLATADGTVFRLGGLQNLATAVRMDDGRLPMSCTPRRCEVIVVGPGDRQLPREPAAGLVVVGRATQVDPVPFSGDLSLSAGEQLVLADGVQGINAFNSLLLIRRSIAWVAPIDPKLVTRESVGPLLKSLADAGHDVEVPGYSVTAPDDGLSSALDRAVVSGRSLALPLSQGALLLWGAMMTVALVLRGSQQTASDRLARRGATRSAVAIFDLISTGTIVGAGAVAGTLVGMVATGILARHSALPAVTILESTWNARTSIAFVGALLILWLATTLLVRWRESPEPLKRRGARVSDLTGLVGAVMLVVLVKRGDTSAEALTSRSDPLLWAMPLLIVTVLVAITPRTVSIMTRAAARLVPPSRVLDRVALLDGARRSIRSIATSAMVATAVAFATFTLDYRSTLLISAKEQAAFVVPFDARLTVGGELVLPPTLRPAVGWGEVVPGTVATDVLRRSATLRRSGSTVDTLDVVGLEPSSLGAMRSWRADYGPSLPKLIRALTVAPPASIGSPIPDGADALALNIDGSAEFTKLAAVMERTDGSWHETVAKPDSVGVPIVPLEPNDAGGKFIGIRVAQLDETASRIEHHVQEGNTSVEALAVGFVLHGVTAMRRDRPIGTLKYNAHDWDDDAGEVRGQPDGSVSIAATILGSSRLIVPKFNPEPAPALVDPLTASAAVDGLITLETQGQEFHFRVVAAADRFPTLGDRFLLTDLKVLRRGFDLAQPGYGAPIETWLAADTPTHESQLSAALVRLPFSKVETDRRLDRIRDQQRDPLSRLSLAVLSWSTLLALAMVAGALMLNSMAERTDDEPFHRALALEGAPRATIHRLVTIRSVSLALASVPIGLGAGALMTTLVSSAIRLTADAVAPNPPLRLAIPWAELAGAMLVFLVVAHVAAGLGARLARRIGPDGLLREVR